MSEYHQQNYHLHTFLTTAGPDRFRAIVVKASKSQFWIDVEGVDRSHVPTKRLYSVAFTSIEDRDRVRIAMRFVDGDKPETNLQAQPQFARA